MNYRDNQPTFNVGNRKVANFKDYLKNKDELKKAELQSKPNSEDQQHIGNKRTEYNQVTHKLTDYSVDEIEDTLDAMEEETNEGMSGDISKLIKRKLDGKNLSQKDFLKLHNWMMENDEDYCKSVDKQMSKDLKKLVPKNTEIKNEGIFSDRYDDSDEITTEEKEICLRVYKQYQKECLDSDGDYSLRFDDWLKRK